MKIHLAYGKKGLDINLPNNVDVIRAPFVPGVPDEKAALEKALRDPIECAPLAEIAKAGDKVVIVHSDITRATPNDRIQPVILAELERAGVRREDITLLNALGTHRAQTEAELRMMLGDFVVDNYRCLQHDMNDDDNLVSLGETTLGHPVRVNRMYMEADVKILTGFIEPHFFAGFSGGPKAVLPAIAGPESVQSNHGVSMIGHSEARWGVTYGNPLWEEMLEVALKSEPSFLLNVSMNSSGEITGVFAGDLQAAHKLGCEFVREHAMASVAKAYDIAVTTNSGYPLDQNLYQCVKGMSAAKQIVRDGGSIVVAGECRDGIPEHGLYAKLLKQAGSVQGIMDMIHQPGFNAQDQWQVQIQAMLQQEADIYVYAGGLSDEQITDALFEVCRDIEGTVSELMTKYGDSARICVMPEGPQTIAYLNGNSRQ